MPSTKGLLSAEEQAAIIAKFEEREKGTGIELKCDACGSTDWILNSYLIGLNSDNPMGAIGSSFRSPAVNIICQVCGQMKFFSASMVGVKPLTAKEAREQDKGDGDGD
jgi:hypothetical protein